MSLSGDSDSNSASIVLYRVRLSGMKIIRPPVAIGHYKMIKHKGDRGNEQNPRR